MLESLGVPAIDGAIVGARLLMLALLFVLIAALVRSMRVAVASAVREADAAESARLVVRVPGDAGLPTGEIFEINGRARIGRADEADVMLDDSFVSSAHAEVVRVDGAWLLVDLGSTNGTLLNDAPIGDRAKVRAGDRLRIGGVELEFIA
jgi:hypothetical protein